MAQTSRAKQWAHQWLDKIQSALVSDEAKLHALLKDSTQQDIELGDEKSNCIARFSSSTSPPLSPQETLAISYLGILLVQFVGAHNGLSIWVYDQESSSYLGHTTRHLRIVMTRGSQKRKEC